MGHCRLWLLQANAKCKLYAFHYWGGGGGGRCITILDANLYANFARCYADFAGLKLCRPHFELCIAGLVFGFVSLNKAMHSRWICKPCFMDLRVLGSVMFYEFVGLNYFFKYVELTLNCALWALFYAWFRPAGIAGQYKVRVL